MFSRFYRFYREEDVREEERLLKEAQSKALPAPSATPAAPATAVAPAAPATTPLAGGPVTN
jgi:hypothetical protein